MIEALAKSAEIGENAKEAKSSFDPDKRIEKSNSFAARQNEGFDPDRRVEKGEPSVGKAEVFDPDKRIEKSNSFTARQNEGFDPDKRVEKNESFDIKQRISFDPDKRVEKDDSFVDKREKVFDPDVKVEKRIPPNDDRIKVGWPPIRTPTTFPTISELDRGIKATEKNATNGDKSKESFNPDMKVAKADASDSKNREISRNKQNEGSVPDRNTEKKDTADSQKSEIPNDKPNGNLDSDKNTNKGDAEDSEKKGLTDEEKEQIKKETGWSDEIINHIDSMEQYEIYKNADLHEAEINGRKCLVKNIDMDYVDPKTGLTNRELMAKGRAPIDAKTGEKIELHHMGQDKDGPFVELCENSEHGDGNHGTLHPKTDGSWRNETGANENYNNERAEHWKTRAQEA